jgi:hypothetical protein
MPKIETLNALRINVPQWFAREDFRAWLNTNDRLATWHNKGQEPTEFSDVFMTYERHEGSDSDLPEALWEELCALCDKEGFTDGIIWLTNLEETV